MRLGVDDVGTCERMNSLTLGRTKLFQAGGGGLGSQFAIRHYSPHTYWRLYAQRLLKAPTEGGLQANRELQANPNKTKQNNTVTHFREMRVVHRRCLLYPAHR